MPSDWLPRYGLSLCEWAENAKKAATKVSENSARSDNGSRVENGSATGFGIDWRKGWRADSLVRTRVRRIGTR